MGLIRAAASLVGGAWRAAGTAIDSTAGVAVGAMGNMAGAVGDGVGGVLQDQFLDYFYMDSLPNDVLMRRAFRRTAPGSRNQGSDDIVSTGSGIAVADGQCMMIIEQGRIMDVCAEPGLYTYDSGAEPSIFGGSFGESFVGSVKEALRRVAHGGDVARVTRVYYFNMKEIMDNLFGAGDIAFLARFGSEAESSLEIRVRCNGLYSYNITNPVLLYRNVIGNIEGDFTRDKIDGMLKAQFLSSLAPALAVFSEQGLRPSQISGKTVDLCKAINEVLKDELCDRRGISIHTIAFKQPISVMPDDMPAFREMEKDYLRSNLKQGAGALVSAQADAMRGAANNTGAGGPVMAFMGMNMAQQAGGMNPMEALQMANQQPQAAPGAPPADSWTCPKCNVPIAGNFCATCGSQKPAVWQCPKCNVTVTGNFCATCGSQKPEEWNCPKCNVSVTGNFCATCGSQKP